MKDQTLEELKQLTVLRETLPMNSLAYLLERIQETVLGSTTNSNFFAERTSLEVLQTLESFLTDNDLHLRDCDNCPDYGMSDHIKLEQQNSYLLRKELQKLRRANRSLQAKMDTLTKRNLGAVNNIEF
jgi:hypothetical protein